MPVYSRNYLVHCLLLGLFSFFFLFSGIALAADSQQWVAKAVSVQGLVQVQRKGNTNWEGVQREDKLFIGDVLRVLEKSSAALVLQNESVVRLNEGTTITVRSQEEPKTLLLKIVDGAVHFFSRTKRSLKVSTPFVNGVVEGTEFFVNVDDTQTYFSVFRGRVRIFNDTGELLLADATTATASQGMAPTLKAVARPRDAVNWALFYPEIVSTDEGGMGEQVLLAHELLKVGRVDSARKVLDQVLEGDPNNSDALALTAIIELVQNQKENARVLAEKAVQTDPKSSSAKMALAYVEQAFFDVEAARDIVREAVLDDPGNAHLWALQSELWLATGYQDNALSSAKKASQLSPDLSRTQTVLGFAYISQIKIKKAKEAFQKAIELDQFDPLARLGLGLALIRGGDLKKGREQIEIAAALDSGNSLVRSYLGKAFYDEKDDKLASRQYEVAKELDPNDPTPYFYSAIQKQTQNRPVEALQDVQKSIALNDNRAVYRSRLLLDQDLAARSASLGRIYNDLGFQQLALVEGWKSVNTDPANYSAHRFLADSYIALPRHEVARVSELLQSQLLQPLNLTPVQPQLADSNQFYLGGSAAGFPTFNEFGPLFVRDRLALSADGIVAENSTLGGDLVLSGLYRKVSLSLGGFHYETDGFRENNDQERDDFNLFLQTAFSPQTSLLFDVRDSSKTEGDLPLRFTFDDMENFSETARNDRDETTARVGLRHSFSPSSHLISHFTYISAEETGMEDFEVDIYEGSVDDNGYLVEAQHLYQKEYFNFVTGAGYVESDRDITIQFLGDDAWTAERKHINAYLYSQITFPKNAEWTLGVSADSLEDEETADRDQFNPKIGLIFKPFQYTTLRAAAFRTLKRLLVAQQTVEPTQVAGFNQFYDDVNGTKAWRYGIALDQTISDTLYGGIEYSNRDLESPSIDLDTGEFVYDDWQEDVLRTYLYYTPHPMWALSAEYLFERFEREGFAGLEEVREVDTHRVPLGVNFFHTTGLIFNLGLSWVDQEGTFGTDPSDFRDGSDQFLLVDAAIRYRLPKRYGIISFGVKNLTDEEFSYNDMDLSKLDIYPERVAFGKITLSF